MLVFPWRFVGLAVGKREFPGYRPPKSTPGLFLDFFRVREALGSTQKHNRTTLEAPTDPFAVSLFSVPGPAPDQNRPEYADPGSSKISRNTQIPVIRFLSPLGIVVKLKRANFGCDHRMELELSWIGSAYSGQDWQDLVFAPFAL